MTVRLKPVSQQIVVITGASSGIGLATACKAAEAGARVVVSSRNGPELDRIVERIRAKGGVATAVVADVTKREDLERLAAEAIKAYGGIDTWVNNAGLGIFGRLEQVSDDDHRRLFDVNFWGVVYGTQIAASHLKAMGGAIINLGSVLSDVAFPVQGMYCASKHAIKGFTDAFRMEMDEQGAPISVTLIKPASIDTPFPIHARNYLDEEPTLPPPVYAPEDVADAIVYAAANGGRDYYIGGGGKLMSALNERLPAAIDWMASRMGPMESSGPPKRPRAGSLHDVASDGDVHGEPTSIVRRSIYTKAETHPLATAAVVAAGVLGAAFLVRSNRS